MQIKNISHLKRLLKKGYLDVKVILSNGLYTRKTVYDNLDTFNYVDETKNEFKTTKQAEKYWKEYFSKHIIMFDGYN